MENFVRYDDELVDTGTHHRYQAGDRGEIELYDEPGDPEKDDDLGEVDGEHGENDRGLTVPVVDHDPHGKQRDDPGKKDGYLELLAERRRHGAGADDIHLNRQGAGPQVDLERHRILKPGVAGSGARGERTDRARPELSRKVRVEGGAVDGLVVEDHHEMVSVRVVDRSRFDGGLPEGLRTRIGEREPDAPPAVGVPLRHPDTGDLVAVEDVLSLVARRLDPYLEEALGADDLLCRRHIHAGEFYPHVLRVLTPCRGEQVDPRVLHTEGVHLLVQDPFHLVCGEG